MRDTDLCTEDEYLLVDPLTQGLDGEERPS